MSRRTAGVCWADRSTSSRGCNLSCRWTVPHSTDGSVGYVPFSERSSHRGRWNPSISETRGINQVRVRETAQDEIAARGFPRPLEELGIEWIQRKTDACCRHSLSEADRMSLASLKTNCFHKLHLFPHPLLQWILLDLFDQQRAGENPSKRIQPQSRPIDRQGVFIILTSVKLAADSSISTYDSSIGVFRVTLTVCQGNLDELYPTV